MEVSRFFPLPSRTGMRTFAPTQFHLLAHAMTLFPPNQTNQHVQSDDRHQQASQPFINFSQRFSRFNALAHALSRAVVRYVCTISFMISFVRRLVRCCCAQTKKKITHSRSRTNVIHLFGWLLMVPIVVLL